MKKLFVFGAGQIGEVALYQLEQNGIPVAGFTAEKEKIERSYFCSHSVYPLSLLHPDTHDIFLAISFKACNSHRKRLYTHLKGEGFTLRELVHNSATVAGTAKIGSGCWIQEGNNLQDRVAVGDNVVMWATNHIGHHSTIGDHVWICSHVVVSGNVTIGERCFLGVNATIADNVTIGEGSIIGAGAVVTKNVPARSVIVPARSTAIARDPERLI